MAFRIASATIVLILVATFAHAQPQQQRLIVGVTDVGRAERELPAQAQVHLKIGISRAFAVTGDPERLRRLPFVRYVEPDPVDAVHIVQTTETLEYGVNNLDAEVVWGGSQGATTVIPGRGGFGAKVAVLDTGIDCNHEDLAGACGTGANFVNFFEPADDHGHGTHVAGIIAARANGVGTIGVAPEATVLPVKVMNAQGSGAWSWVAAGIEWAVNNGAHVISMSLSGNPGSQAVADAVAYAQSRGVLVVSAAGNSGCCNTIGYPALYPGSMAVGAVDVNDVIASFSSTGPALDVVAPGVAVKAPVPIGVCALCHPTGYMLLNGTSMATPHVSGVAALLMTREVTPFTAAQAWNAITSTARDLGAAGHDPIYGHGRVDALAANNSTPSEPPPPPPPPPVDNVPPSVVITSPGNWKLVQPNSLVTIRASASDNVGVTRVEFYVDLVGKCLDTTAPYTCNWVVPPGKNLFYLIHAFAFDAAGNNAGSQVIVYTPGGR